MARVSLVKNAKLPMPCPNGWGRHDEANVSFVLGNRLTDGAINLIWSSEGHWAYILPSSYRSPEEQAGGRG